MSIGYKMKLIRKKKNLSRKQIADAIGVHENTILGFENGKRSVSVKTFIAMAEAMGYDVILKRKPD